ncbi:MAG: hypothetical protein QXZ28_01235 [Candidatus Methanomethylicaceae archaeon]
MTLKETFILRCPDVLFIPIANNYYEIMSNFFNKEKIKIKKLGPSYLIQKEDLQLLSPTPKFLGFGLKQFTNKFERFFKIEKGETVADIGACIGDTTLPMCVKTGADGKIFAVEPHPVNVSYLKLNLNKFTNVKIIKLLGTKKQILC